MHRLGVDAFLQASSLTSVESFHRPAHNVLLGVRQLREHWQGQQAASGGVRDGQLAVKPLKFLVGAQLMDRNRVCSQCTMN